MCEQCGTSWPYTDDGPKQCPDCADHLGEPLPEDRMTTEPFFLDENIHGIEALWMRRPERPSQPLELLNRFDLPPEARKDAWPFIRAALASALAAGGAS